MKAPRIAIFTGAYNHIVDGVSLTLNRWVAFLEREGYAVLVFAPTRSVPAFEHVGRLVSVPSLPAPGRPDYRITLGLTGRALRTLVSFAPHLCHVATPDLLGLAVRRFTATHGMPLVASYHTDFCAYLPYYGLHCLRRPLLCYLRWFYGRCRHVYLPSPAPALVERLDIRRSFRFWPRGVDRNQFRPNRRSMAWRRSMGIKDSEAVVFFASRLVREKGLPTLVKVLQILQEKGVPHRAMIAGDGPARTKIQNQLPRCIFLGHVPQRELGRAYSSSDLFLFPSVTETFGNVVLEAMASQLPTVCADSPAARCLIVAGETGLLAAPDQPDSFVAGIERLLEDSGLRLRMGEAARSRSRRFTWEASLRQIRGHYDCLLGGVSIPTVSDREGTEASPAGAA